MNNLIFFNRLGTYLMTSVFPASQLHSNFWVTFTLHLHLKFGKKDKNISLLIFSLPQPQDLLFQLRQCFGSFALPVCQSNPFPCDV